MNWLRASLLLAAGCFLTAVPSQAAKKKPGLLPYAGSYTGKAVSKGGASSLSGSATLTFTGKTYGLRGSFLYTGILNQAGTAQNVIQTFNLTSKGVLSGRVTVGSANGTGTGKIHFIKKKNTVTFTETYKLYGSPGTTITLTGKIVFKTKRALLTATVTSSDPTFAGTLSVTGKR